MPHYLGQVATGVAATVTILFLAFLMLLEGPLIQRGALQMIENPERRERVRRVTTDAARAVTGYMFGNLLISVIAGTLAYLFLLIIGVPFKEVLGLWVAFADLIPLVGATLGAVPAVAVAFLHSVPAGIATLIFFIVYQQFENHVLQVSIMSKTVKLNPLTVLISILDRRRTVRHPGCAARHPGRRHHPGRRPRSLGRAARPPEGRSRPSARTRCR